MPGIYARWIDNWERKLATRDTNRVVRPFEWGLDWLGGLEFPALSDHRNDHAREALDRFAEEALGDSDRFFTYRVPADYQLRNGHLTFTSPVETPYPENNIVHAEWFPVERSPRRAVLVLPLALPTIVNAIMFRLIYNPEYGSWNRSRCRRLHRALQGGQAAGAAGRELPDRQVGAAEGERRVGRR